MAKKAQNRKVKNNLPASVLISAERLVFESLRIPRSQMEVSEFTGQDLRVIQAAFQSLVKNGAIVRLMNGKYKRLQRAIDYGGYVND